MFIVDTLIKASTVDVHTVHCIFLAVFFLNF